MQKMVRGRSKLLPFVINTSVFMGMLVWLVVSSFYKDSYSFSNRYSNPSYKTNGKEMVEVRSLDNDGGREPDGETVSALGNPREPASQYSPITSDKFPIIRNALRNYFLYVNDPGNNPSSYKSSVLAFVHNHKSGGTTLKQCLTKLLQKQNSQPVLVTNNNRATVEENILNGVSEINKNDVFVGAATFGVCENLSPRTCAYFTILREPYERMISHYLFCLSGGETGLGCQNITIVDYAISIGSILFTHISAHMVCKKSCVSFNENCATGTNDLAWRCERLYSSYQDDKRSAVLGYMVRNLDRFFAVIGLFEEYETSLEMFQEAFGVPLSDDCSEIHANKGAYRDVQGSNEDIGEERRRYTEDLKRELKANTTVSKSIEADVKIYERAREIFYKQKEIYLRTRS